MARPENTDSSQTRRLILERATARFANLGFVGATVRAIASDAGVTLATVHHHFGTKLDLYRACLERAYASQLEHGPEILAVLQQEELPLRERVEGATRVAFRLARKFPARSRFLLRFSLFERPQADGALEEQGALERQYADMVITGLGEFLGHPDPKHVRVPLLGLGYLLARFAVVPLDKLPFDVGSDPQELEDYVATVAVETLLP